jgi:isocitrate dehydrogenase kinase/phosphatase
MKLNTEKIIAWFVGGLIMVMLTVIGFLAKETFATIKDTFVSIKSLEKDVVNIRLKLTELEAKRISRDELERIIRDYHDNHPCIAFKQGAKK